MLYFLISVGGIFVGAIAGIALVYLASKFVGPTF